MKAGENMSKISEKFPNGMAEFYSIKEDVALEITPNGVFKDNFNTTLV